MTNNSDHYSAEFTWPDKRFTEKSPTEANESIRIEEIPLEDYVLPQKKRTTSQNNSILNLPAPLPLSNHYSSLFRPQLQIEDEETQEESEA